MIIKVVSNKGNSKDINHSDHYKFTILRAERVLWIERKYALGELLQLNNTCEDGRTD